MFLNPRTTHTELKLPKRENFILVSPKSMITRPSGKGFDTSQVIKADTLRTKMDEDFDKTNTLAEIASFGKICSASTLEEAAKQLVSFHKPHRVDLRARFGLPEKTYKEREDPSVLKEKQVRVYTSTKFFCAKCKKSISKRVAKFCWQNKGKFGGKAYCFDCQKAIVTIFSWI
jgi:hypothetical protein